MSEMKTITLNGKKYDGFVDPVARELATAFAVINSASGESITVSDASDSNLRGLSIYGKTTQNGTPTPDAPVDLVSVGDGGSITVSVTGESKSQSMTIATPNGLPGIPVTSGGNYTDADGQQWICDEIDLARGVYVQQIGQETIGGSTTLVRQAENHTLTLSLFVACNEWGVSENYGQMALLCTIAVPGAAGSTNDTKVNVCRFNATVSNFLFDVSLSEYPSVEAFKNHITEHPFYVYYILGAPVETPLSEEELAAYADLYTYREHTTVSNDGHAYMELEYVMDAKKYIDSLVVAGGASARLSNVTLLASKWTGSDSLYSQVVTIDGITPYSKVDLLPSVEQLAIFHNKDVAFVTENEDGVVTVFAIGDKPTQDYTMQVSITEVVV